MSYADDLKIFMNILAQSPDGMSDPQLVNKFAKAKSMLNGLQSMNQMQAQGMIPPPSAPPMMDTSNGMTPIAGNIPQSNEGMPPNEPQNPIL